jgi:hypothetical protein
LSPGGERTSPLDLTANRRGIPVAGFVRRPECCTTWEPPRVSVAAEPVGRRMAPLAVAADEPTPGAGANPMLRAGARRPSRWTGAGPVVPSAGRRWWPGRVRPHGGDAVPPCRETAAVSSDRRPESCTFAQLDQPISFELGDVVPGLGR